jgi:MFS family permease
VISKFWLASAWNSGSTWMLQIALSIQVLQQATVGTLAMVQLAGTLPALLCMPAAGVLADRTRPRPVAWAAMLVQTVCVAAMALGPALGILALLYGLQGAANALWAPARQQWLYGVLPAEQWTSANAALGSVSGVMTVLGAALGGGLSAWSTQLSLTVAATVQLLAVLPLIFLPRPGKAAAPSARRSFLGEVVEGFTALRGLPMARSVVLVGIAWGFIGGAYDVLLAGYATGVVHGGAATLGVLYIVDGLGVLGGAWLAIRLSAGRQLPAYALSYVVQGIGWSAMFLTGNPGLGGALLAVMRGASGVIIALDTTLLLADVPAVLRGRVTSVHITTYSAVSRLSLAVFGGVLSLFGTQAVGITTGLASVLVGIVWWRSSQGGRRQVLE